VIGAPLLLAAVTMLACYVPARRSLESSAAGATRRVIHLAKRGLKGQISACESRITVRCARLRYGIVERHCKNGQIYNETNFMLVSTSSRMLLRDMRKAQIVVILGAKY